MLDFTGLQKISNREPNRQEAQEREDAKPKVNKLSKEAYNKRDELERAREVYAQHQEAIKATQILQSEILKDLKEDAPKDAILLKALKCVSLATGNQAFYEQAQKNLRKN